MKIVYNRAGVGSLGTPTENPIKSLPLQIMPASRAMPCGICSSTTTRLPTLPTPGIEQSYDYCFMSCSHCLVYLIPDGLGNLKITVVAGAATLIVVIFSVLCWFCASSTPSAHKTQKFAH